MFSLLCPACGGQVTFKSKASVFSVCSYCKATLVRHDINLEVYGTMADVQLDVSPLQIGTRGQFNKKSFELVGRMRLRWSDGFWNEWYALFDDGRAGWLAEAQGFYAMNFEDADNWDLPPASQLFPGTAVMLKAHGKFQVDDIKKAECIGSEGELPIRAPKGRHSVSVDLSGEDGQFACIEYPAGELCRVFLGRYYDFDQFKFSFLRELDGW